MTNLCFFSLRIRNVKALGGEYFFDFADSAGRPAKWIVVIGDNNTGKTTLLRCIASMQLRKREEVDSNGKLDVSYGIPYDLLYSEASTQSDEPSFVKVGIASPLFNITTIHDDKRKRLLIDDIFLYNNVVDGSGMFGIIKQPKGSIPHSYNLLDGELSPDIVYASHKIYGYGTSRRLSTGSLNTTTNKIGIESLFSNNTDLMNLEQWLIQLDYSSKNQSSTAERIFDKVKEIITNSFFCKINDIRFVSPDNINYRVEVLINSTWLWINDLGYGYQSTMAWVIDLVKQLYDRYHMLANPLEGYAIVLVDEIDLHLHPDWQRKIIKYLSDLFPNTQFIVTAHSPLIVQSAENANLIMLEKNDETDSINIRQQFGSFQGWTVEEILRELMDMGDKTRSDKFLALLKDFEEALDEESYEKAKIAYDGLDKILHPASSQRKLLSIQLSSLIPA